MSAETKKIETAEELLFELDQLRILNQKENVPVVELN